MGHFPVGSVADSPVAPGGAIELTAGMIPSGGQPNTTNVAWNGFLAIVNTNIAKAQIAQAITENVPLFMASGQFDVQGQIGVLMQIPVLYGNGANSELRFGTGAGFLDGTVSGGNGLPYTPATADGLGTGLVLGDNTNSYNSIGGLLYNVSITSANRVIGGPPGPILYGSSLSNAPGVTVNGCTNFLILNVTVDGFGIGVDWVNNCGGSSYFNLQCGSYGNNNVGMQLRTASQSGSDIKGYMGWIHGLVAAAMVDGGGDYWYDGGQMGANHGNAMGCSFQAGPAPVVSPTVQNDSISALVVGRNFADGTISVSDNLPGTPSTGGTNGVGAIRIQNVDLEGTRFGWAAFRAYVLMTLTIEDSHIIAYSNPAAPSVTTDATAGIGRCSYTGKSTVRLIGGTISGYFSNVNLLQFHVPSMQPGFQLVVDDPHGQQVTQIAGYNGNAGLANGWTNIDSSGTATNGYATNLCKLSSVGVPYRAGTGGITWQGNGTGTDTGQRADGLGNLQLTSDGNTWVTVATSGSLPIAVDYCATGILPNSPTYAAGVITAGANINLQLDGCTGGLRNGTTLLVPYEASAGGLGGAACGIYAVTQGGSTVGGTPWIITRIAPLAQGTVLPTYQPEPGTLPTPLPIRVNVSTGATKGGTSWYLTNLGQTVGTTALVFVTSQTSATAPPAASVVLPADPTGTASTANPGVMAGLAIPYTPVASGSLLVRFDAQAWSSTALANVRIRGCIGTGAAPANGAAVTGTQYGQTPANVKSVGTTSTQGATISHVGKITGLAVGTTYWLDLAFSTSAGADLANLTNIACTIQEVT